MTPDAHTALHDDPSTLTPALTETSNPKVPS
jgi:hypothetical protein